MARSMPRNWYLQKFQNRQIEWTSCHVAVTGERAVRRGTVRGMIPAVLASDPWVPARKRDVLSLTPVVRERILWNPGEREALLRPRRGTEADHARLREEERAMFLRGGIIPIHAGWWLALEDLPALAAARLGGAFVSHHDLLGPQLARHELAAIPTLLSLLPTWPREVLWTLVRIDSTEIARAFWDSRATSPALFPSYAASQPLAAALVLLPHALGPEGDARKAALAEVKRLRKAGHDAELREAAAQYGEPAQRELAAIFAPPPLPSKAPKLPAFVSVEALPTPLLVDGSALPLEGTQRLLALASLLPQDSARAAVDSALPALDRARLSDLADALLSAWLAAGAPTKEKWVIHAAALLGDDRAVRAMVAHVAEWAEQKLSARVKLAVEAITSIGSDVALMHVSFLAKKKGAAKKAALAGLERFREEHELTEDELQDRLVPDLGLDAQGQMVFDYGARSFRAGFDEQLLPFVIDASGTKTTSLPRPNKQDDAEKVEKAQALWQALKGETKALAAEQVRRLERAMVAGRRWDADAFRRYFLHHPLMQHVARRVVWAAFVGGARSPALTFRIAEDGSFADQEDASCTLPENARFTILHPLLMEDSTRTRWSGVLSDYQIIQPFPQLGRELFVPTDEERTAHTSTRFVGKQAPGARFFSLKHRGWRFSDYDMGKPVGTTERPIEATLSTEPGLHFLAAKPEDQTLGELTLRWSGLGATDAAPVFGDLEPVAASELLRDVDALFR